MSVLRKAGRFFQRHDQSVEAPAMPRIYNEPYFYGRITRAEGETILLQNGKKDGLFLLRESITPMGNFSLSMTFKNDCVHYSIEKQVDGKYMIPDGRRFKDPVDLIEFYKVNHSGLIIAPKTPCIRHSSQEPIAYRGLSYIDLHEHMKTAAKNMNANMTRSLGSLHDSFMIHVLTTIHESLPWYHGQITRDLAMERLRQSGVEDGKFIVRYKPESSTYALTMCHEGSLRHYIISSTDSDNFHIENGPKFKALIILVDHYHNRRDGLPCNLKIACCNPDFRHHAWERYKRLSMDITDTPQLTAMHLPERCTSGAWSPPPRLPPPPPPEELNRSDSPHLLMERENYLAGLEAEEAHGHAVLAISNEEAERLENVYIDIRSTVMSTELKVEQIELEDKTLGSGHFGDVIKGKCCLGKKIVPVAVKTLKENSPAGQFEIEREATLMKQLDHPNIVRMIGVCMGSCLMLVMELAELGPLKKFLQHNKSMSQSHRVELMLQICDGMKYLESKAVIHRDLATRNVLLMTEHFAKISDFGMSRIVSNESEYYRAEGRGRWPLMWYAPECLYYHKFDSKSDVWSFGVTMWEIMSNGKRPYERMKPPQILHFLEQGKRMPKPENCVDKLYDIMMYCWEFDKEIRPTFTEVKFRMEPLYIMLLNCKM